MQILGTADASPQHQPFITVKSLDASNLDPNRIPFSFNVPCLQLKKAIRASLWSWTAEQGKSLCSPRHVIKWLAHKKNPFGARVYEDRRIPGGRSELIMMRSRSLAVRRRASE